MKNRTDEIRYFFNSQAFADGIRATISILLPALIFSFLGKAEAGLAISLGALCANIADAPGPIIHKRNGILFCCLFVFIVSLITSFALLNTYTLGLEIVLVSFLFSMFNVYGSRAASVGTAVILVMILSMEKPIPLQDILPNSLFILAGGLWHFSLSMLFYNLAPYRPAQRDLGECIREIATFLSYKADFYDEKTNIDDNYKRLIAQQIVVNDRQNALREILFKTRQIVNESTAAGRKLVLTFVATVDLFEDITASYYDYEALRRQFGHTGILHDFNRLIKQMAGELDRMGIAIQANEQFKRNPRLETELKNIKEKIDVISKQEAASSIILIKVMVNLRTLLQRFNELCDYFSKKQKNRPASLDHSAFVTHQELDPKILWDNLTLQSSVFKHALRVSLACITGFAIAHAFSGHHSYWIVMTIAFMLKPAFSLTKQRNIQRISGTILGGVIAILILVFIPNKTIQFAFMVLFMLGTYSFQRIKYFIAVTCTTPFVLILFKLLGVGFINVAEERLLDTAIGCAIAFLAGYFLFPHWESNELENFMLKMLKANTGYLRKIAENFAGHPVSLLEYKLARKDVYVSSANLSAAFQRMLSEPKSKQMDSSKVHQFVVLNHILFSNIATVATSILNNEHNQHMREVLPIAKRAIGVLCENIKKFSNEETGLNRNFEINSAVKLPPEQNQGPEDQFLREHLSFILKICVDISKSLDHIMLPETSQQPAYSL